MGIENSSKKYLLIDSEIYVIRKLAVDDNLSGGTFSSEITQKFSHNIL